MVGPHASGTSAQSRVPSAARSCSGASIAALPISSITGQLANKRSSPEDHERKDTEIYEESYDSMSYDEFTVPLHLRADRGSSFRVQNDPLNPWQRANIIERKGDLDVRCSLIDVVHGKLNAEGNDKATLLVLRFRFDPRRRARRSSKSWEKHGT